MLELPRLGKAFVAGKRVGGEVERFESVFNPGLDVDDRSSWHQDLLKDEAGPLPGACKKDGVLVVDTQLIRHPDAVEVVKQGVTHVAAHPVIVVHGQKALALQLVRDSSGLLPFC